MYNARGVCLHQRVLVHVGAALPIYRYLDSLIIWLVTARYAMIYIYICIYIYMTASRVEHPILFFDEAWCGRNGQQLYEGPINKNHCRTPLLTGSGRRRQFWSLSGIDFWSCHFAEALTWFDLDFVVKLWNMFCLIPSAMYEYTYCKYCCIDTWLFFYVETCLQKIFATYSIDGPLMACVLLVGGWLRLRLCLVWLCIF